MTAIGHDLPRRLRNLHALSRPVAPHAASTPASRCASWHDSGLVVTTSYGTPYEPRNFNRHFAARCRAANVRSISPHGMRRTCGSLLAALDVHPRVAMRILRHSKIAITMEVYTEVPGVDAGRSASAGGAVR